MISTGLKLKSVPNSVKEDGIYKTITLKDNGTHEIRISSTPCIITAIGINIDTGEILINSRLKTI